jgi:class 3 adenylate cyclase
VFKRRLVNRNIFRTEMYAETAKACLETEQVVLGRYYSAPAGNTSHPNMMTSLNAAMLSIAAKKEVTYAGDPMTNVFLPVFDSFKDGDTSTKRTIVAVMTALIHWESYFKEILPPNVRGLVLILDNGCDGTFTYRIDGLDVRSIGFGDHHRNKFDEYERSTSLTEGLNIAAGTRLGLELKYGGSGCQYDLRVYPSQEFYDEYNTSTPIIMTSAVAMVFVFTAFMFLVYDRLVERRQKLVLMKAAQSNAIVSSLFPKNVRDRMMQETGNVSQNNRLKSFLKGDSKDEDVGLQPIADLFPHCTVLFADISGFTAWSSTREPAQVFTLLQTLYQAFDVIARRRRVFKVETIGDSYLAVTGLPEPQDSHVLIMAKFAADCRKRMNEVTKELEVTLGPDTCDLSMRFGLHSGPVTAGVLRGERSRFQLFGDTVNTAARMER